MLKTVCDICGKDVHKDNHFRCSMQIDKADLLGFYKTRYLFKDLCPKCAKAMLKYIGELKIAEEVTE